MPDAAIRVSALILLLATASCRSRTHNALPDQQARSANANVTGRQGCVNLNTATAEELDKRLKGIGPVTAQKIIDYRERMGPFQKPEEVIVVDGMSEGKYRQIADQLCVN